MDPSEERYLIVFKSSNHAMLLYKELVKAECKVELISTPCRLSRGCSQSIVFNSKDSKIIIDAINKNNIAVANIYKIVEGKNYTNYVPI